MIGEIYNQLSSPLGIAIMMIVGWLSYLAILNCKFNKEQRVRESELIEERDCRQPKREDKIHTSTATARGMSPKRKTSVPIMEMRESGQLTRKSHKKVQS